MKYGIYYAYWESEWGGDFLPYIKKVKKLGFDILEVACGDFTQKDNAYFRELKRVSEGEGIILTGGYGPKPEHNLGSADNSIVNCAFNYWSDALHKMELAGIDRVGGALYSYWPVDYSKGIDKSADMQRSVENMMLLADIAINHGVTLNMEVLNRFEGYMLNDCAEAIRYVKLVNKPNVKVMLDTFHMNIEEDSLTEAIREAGSLLGHFHVGEANRKPPFAKGRICWENIGDALMDIGYEGYVVMEPFVKMGGQVGKDIFIWRDLSNGATEEDLDRSAADSLKYLRGLWES